MFFFVFVFVCLCHTSTHTPMPCVLFFFFLFLSAKMIDEDDMKQVTTPHSRIKNMGSNNESQNSEKQPGEAYYDKHENDLQSPLDNDDDETGLLQNNKQNKNKSKKQKKKIMQT